MMMTSSPGASRQLPAVDARLVAGESGYEIVDGRLVAVPPALEPHGERHSKLNALLEAFATAEYNVACDMLTRTSETTDIAPDASVYPLARDPATGGRLIEELAFEIVGTQALGDAADKARRLAARGVRRVFAVDVPHQRVHEWSPQADGWRLLSDASAIEDPVLALPLPVEALVKAAKADDAMAAALLAKNNPVIAAAQQRARSEGMEEGRAVGQRRALLLILASRSVRVDAGVRERIEAESDETRLDAWLERAMTATDVTDVVRED